MPTTTNRKIAYTLPWNDAPIDISFIFDEEKPAGKRGFLEVKGSHFAFPDGTVARFWGTNLNSGACFPTHAHSEMVARRLAKFGVNLVRLHQMDADYSTPNLFQFTKGRRLADTQSLDPESLERLDYLIHCLKREGIYIYMDLLTYRIFRIGDEVAAAEKLALAARPYSNFDPRLIELQKKFNEQLWTHVNPYTGLAYKDEPAIAMTDITAENDIFTRSFRMDLLEPYRSDLQKRFAQWAKAKGIETHGKPADFSNDDPEIIAFLSEVQKNYFVDMTRHMRQMGVRIPIAGTNWYLGGAALTAAQMVTDFTDAHTYWYDWCWKGSEKKFTNRSMLGLREAWFAGLAFCRVLHKPFFVSEWENPWPNEFRAEGSMLMASAGCFQGWSGATIHTYRYDCRENIDLIGAPITSDAIGGVYHRGGMFDTFNDPAKFGLFYHAALMTRRADVRESDSATEVVIPKLLRDEDLIVDPAKEDAMPFRVAGGKLVVMEDVLALPGAVEAFKVGVRLPGEPARTTRQQSMAEPLVPENVTEIRSDTGELYRNLTKRFATIDSPRTKVAYGFLAAAGEIRLSGMKIEAQTDYAVIAISSLTDAAIAQSDNLLLTAVGRADNTDSEYNADHTIQLKLGHGPILAEVIEAQIELATDQTNLRIWSINPGGYPIGPIPVTYEGGIAKFTLGRDFPSIYYLIQQA